MNEIMHQHYAQIYFLIGACIILYLVIKTVTEYLGQSNFVKDITKMMGGKPSFNYYSENIALYSLAITVILIAWPLIIIWASYENYKDRNRHIESIKPKFHCTQKYLVRKVTIPEAEKENMIFDPLSMTPRLPFGHLHKGWVDFIRKLSTQDELWLFEIPDNQITGKYQHVVNGSIRGYAQLRNAKIIAEFMFEKD